MPQFFVKQGLFQRSFLQSSVRMTNQSSGSRRCSTGSPFVHCTHKNKKAQKSLMLQSISKQFYVSNSLMYQNYLQSLIYAAALGTRARQLQCTLAKFTSSIQLILHRACRTRVATCVTPGASN